MPTIPMLLGEKNLGQWKLILRQTLEVHHLCQYIDATIPEPQDEDQQLQWETDRATVNLIMTASLTQDTTWQALINNGWDSEEEDPRVTYETVLRAIPMVFEPAVGTIITSKKWRGRCQKEVSVKVMHCKECGKCHGGQLCWKKCPELAPDTWGKKQGNTKKYSTKTARSTIAAADQTSGLGYGNIHAKINSTWNPTEDETIRSDTVRFESPDFNAKTNEQEPHDEVVFTNPTIDEVEKRLSICVTEVITNTCTNSKNGTQGLPTPKETAEPDPQVSEIQLVAEDVAEIVHEAPIPPKNPIEVLSTPETTLERHLRASDIVHEEPIYFLASEIQLDAKNMADIAREAPIPPGNPLPTPEATPEHDLQASEIQLDAEYVADIFHKAPIPPEHIPNPAAQSDVISEGRQQSDRTKHEAGRYKTLATGRHSNSNYFHLVDNHLQEAMEYSLSFWKIQIPENTRQARKCLDYGIKWLPAMKQQFDRVWTIVPIKPNMKVSLGIPFTNYPRRGVRYYQTW